MRRAKRKPRVSPSARRAERVRKGEFTRLEIPAPRRAGRPASARTRPAAAGTVTPSARRCPRRGAGVCAARISAQHASASWCRGATVVERAVEALGSRTCPRFGTARPRKIRAQTRLGLYRPRLARCPVPACARRRSPEDNAPTGPPHHRARVCLY